jgi:hypothetical protein
VFFFLGSHRPNWLGLLTVPLFVSHRTLQGRKTYPVATCDWALDSGGFTELSMHGQWVTTEDEYVEAVATYQDRIGRLQWAAPMDWMCEPWIEKTGLSVREHQERTVSNYLAIRDRGPFIPVLQGWEPQDYLDCVSLYEDAGVDLAALPLVGVGSVCRRQSEAEIGWIMSTLARRGLKLHGFGVKKEGLKRYGRYLESADSMAWSYNARRNWPLPECSHKSCANCWRYALRLMPSKTERRLNAFLLLMALIFTWCAGVNAATHHWLDMGGEFGGMVLALALRGWRVTTSSSPSTGVDSLAPKSGTGATANRPAPGQQEVES